MNEFVIVMKIGNANATAKIAAKKIIGSFLRKTAAFIANYTTQKPKLK